MSRFAGSLIRLLATLFYALEFCCAAIILGAYSYFLSVLADHSLPIRQQWKAVEGISGIAVVYTVAAVILTCFLGGIKFFAFLAIVLDVVFCAGFIALAVLTRDGASSCSGYVDTPIGSGNANTRSQGFGQNGFGTGSGENVTYFPRLSFACRLNSAAFAVAIVGAFLFLFSVFLQLWVSRHAQKDKKYGPSPANNYTSGSGRKKKFWQRGKKGGAGAAGAAPYTQDPHAKDTELGTYEAAGGTGVANGGGTTLATDQTANPYRPSGDTGHTGHTGYTGTTMAPQDHHQPQYGGANKYDHGGYHTGPTGTSVNPYGYDSRPGAASNF